MVHLPAASAWPVAFGWGVVSVGPWTNSCTVALASAVPWIRGWVFWVLWSVLDAPVSSVLSTRPVMVTAGALVSMTSAGAMAADAALTLPLRSVSLAVIW